MSNCKKCINYDEDEFYYEYCDDYIYQGYCMKRHNMDDKKCKYFELDEVFIDE